MITAQESRRLECIQKTALDVILGSQYKSCLKVLSRLNLETLEENRKSLYIRFALKTVKQKKLKHWFVKNPLKTINTRIMMSKWRELGCRTDRYRKSPIPYYTRILNENVKDWDEVVPSNINKCDQCKETFTTPNNMMVHRRIKHITDGCDPQWSVKIQ